MNQTMERIKVVMSAAVTYLTTAAVILGIFNEELGSITQLPDWVGQVLAGAISVIGVAVVIIRRVEPVIPTRRGILEPPHEFDRAKDRGAVDIATVEVAVAVAVAVAATVFAAAVLASWIAL